VAAVETARVVREAGFAVAFCDDQAGELGVANDPGVPAGASLLVTIGGDGTLLRAAQIAAPHGIPLFGVNTGRLGFLTEVDGRPQELVGLLALLRAGFYVDERTALVAELAGRSFFALNDIVIRRTGTAHMTPLRLLVDGREAAHVPADGIIVATPTGSTAYALSAGGPILWPDVPAICVIALAPHTLFTRPIVVPNTATITLSSDAEDARIALEADGREVGELHATESVTVRRYPTPVRFARREPLNFPRLLENKLRWNAPIKEPDG
jgi:NAD+ kinase